jgi:periplasmic protein CpxP/Spy
MCRNEALLKIKVFNRLDLDMNRLFINATLASVGLASSLGILPLSSPAVGQPTLQTQDTIRVQNSTPKTRRSPESDLGLTEDQRRQIEQIRQETRSQLEAILTPEQKAQLQQARQNRPNRGDRPTPPDGSRPGQPGQQPPTGAPSGPRAGRPSGPPPGLRELNLSTEQQTQIKQLMQTERQKIFSVLTTEQQQKLQQRMPPPPQP